MGISRSRARAASIIMIAGMMAASMPARSDAIGAGTLATPADVVTWTGSFDGPTPECYAEAAPEVVVLGGEAVPLGLCSEYHLTVDLPEGTWEQPGGVQVSIHWPYAPLDKELDMAIYDPDGALIAYTFSTDTDAESILIPQASNGTYRVLIGALYSDGVTYTGRAEVEYFPPVEPVRELLPDLRAFPQRNLRLAVTDPAGPLINGCMPLEITEQDAARCLRFDQIIANVGNGPMELRYSGEDLGGDQVMYQRVYRSDGSVVDTAVSSYEVHLAHGHIHYTGFAQSLLWVSDETGGRSGDEPLRTGRKNGFCLIDVQLLEQDVKGDAPRTYDGSGCADVAGLAQGAQGVLGISTGWADTYNWYLPDQYIEVSGVQDGYYILETIADPDGTVAELDEQDNSVAVHIRICGDHAEIVGAQPSACESMA